LRTGAVVLGGEQRNDMIEQCLCLPKSDENTGSRYSDILAICEPGCAL
jgi:hypothetical protein